MKRSCAVVSSVGLLRFAMPASAQEETQIAACQASGLLALKEKAPAVKDITVDREGLIITNVNAKFGSTPIRTVLIGPVFVQKNKGGKPYTLLCLIGEKGNVELTVFTQK